MKNAIPVVLALLFFSGDLFGQVKAGARKVPVKFAVPKPPTPYDIYSEGLDLAKLEIDQVGRVIGGHVENFSIQKVLGDGEILVQGYALTPMVVGRGVNAQPVEKFAPWGAPVVVRVASTRGLVDGKGTKLSDVYKVTGTAKPRGRTVFVLEPAKGEDRAKIEAREKEKTEAQAKVIAAVDADAKMQEEKKPRSKTPVPEPAKPDPEKDAARKLKLAKGFLEFPNKDKATARKRLKEIVDKYPGTKAAKEAAALLDKLDG